MNISESQIDNLVNLLDGYAEKGGLYQTEC